MDLSNRNNKIKNNLTGKLSGIIDEIENIRIVHNKYLPQITQIQSENFLMSEANFSHSLSCRAGTEGSNNLWRSILINFVSCNSPSLSA